MRSVLLFMARWAAVAAMSLAIEVYWLGAPNSADLVARKVAFAPVGVALWMLLDRWLAPAQGVAHA